jgi:TolB-like protein
VSWRHLLDELRRRRVYRVSAAYVIGAFALLQGADIVLPALGAPPWVLSVLVVLAIGALPLAAVMAWLFDVTPRGIERTQPLSEEGDASASSVPKALVMAGIAGVVLISLLVGGGAWVVIRGPGSSPLAEYGSSGTPGPSDPTSVASVAVLPCVDVSAGRDAEYFGEGITEEIIGELARFEGLRVISRTSVMALKGSMLTLPQIADTLRVEHVLECSIQRSGTRIRVRAQLIDPRSDHTTWSELFDREVSDVLSVQEEIARQVGLALLSRLPEVRSRFAQAHSPSPQAYDAYLRGTAARRQPSPTGLLSAVAAFEEAIESDPSFSLAYSGLSQVHVVWTLFGYTGGPDHYERVALGSALAERALVLDSLSAEAWAARAHAGLRAWLPSQVILADIDRAVELAPGSGEIRLLRAVALAFADRFEDALAETESAVALDPLASGHHDFRAMSLLLAGRPDEALREARLARALAPDFPHPIRQEVRALLLLGRFSECAGMDVGPYLPLQAMCLHSLGRTDEAGPVIDELVRALDGFEETAGRHAGGMAADIAEYHAWLGDGDRAIEWLERSVASSPAMQFLVHGTATYDRVRSDPVFSARFEELKDEVRRRVEAARPHVTLPWGQAGIAGS